MSTRTESETLFTRAQRILDGINLPMNWMVLDERGHRAQEALDLIREICDGSGDEQEKWRARNLFLTACRRWCSQTQELLAQALPERDSIEIAEGLMENLANVLRLAPFVGTDGQEKQLKEIEGLRQLCQARRR